MQTIPPSYLMVGFYLNRQAIFLFLFVLIMPPSNATYAHNVKLLYHQGKLCKATSKTESSSVTALLRRGFSTSVLSSFVK